MGMPERTVVDETVDAMIKTIVSAGRQVSVTVRLGPDYERRLATHVEVQARRPDATGGLVSLIAERL